MGPQLSESTMRKISAKAVTAEDGHVIKYNVIKPIKVFLIQKLATAIQNFGGFLSKAPLKGKNGSAVTTKTHLTL